MADKKTIRHQGEMKALLPDYLSPEVLQSADCVGQLLLAKGDPRYWIEKGYIEVGIATVSIEVMADGKDLMAAKVEGLQAELRATRADAERKCNEILTKISKLQALEWDGQGVEVSQ